MFSYIHCDCDKFPTLIPLVDTIVTGPILYLVMVPSQNKRKTKWSIVRAQRYREV